MKNAHGPRMQGESNANLFLMTLGRRAPSFRKRFRQKKVYLYRSTCRDESFRNEVLRLCRTQHALAGQHYDARYVRGITFRRVQPCLFFLRRLVARGARLYPTYRAEVLGLIKMKVLL